MDIENVYLEYYRNVHNYIAFRINNRHDVEELASLTFEKALAAWGAYDPARAVEGWLIGIAKNVVTDYLRASAKRTLAPLESVLHFKSPERQPCEAVMANEENRALLRAMARLRERERQILSMKFATGLKSGEIAEILGMREAAVRTAVHRSVKRLREILEVENEGL